jgi:hypothetical protein
MVKPFSNTRFAPGTLVSRLRSRYAHAKPAEFSRRANSGKRMRFKVIVGEQVYSVEVPEHLLHEAAEFHAKLDRDMDRGWQMSRQFVDRPDPLQRCQIVADKLLTSIIHNNEATAMLMAGYIALRMPGAIGVDIDASGEMQNTELLYA